MRASHLAIPTLPPMRHQSVVTLHKSMHLYTIPFSHFCEKARWGLAYYGIPYTEHKYLPMLHLFPMLWHSLGRGKADRHSSPASTPMLRTETGERYCDSSLILVYLSTRFGKPPGDLYPTPQVREFERLFSNTLGPDARRIAYFHILQSEELTADICFRNVGALQTNLLQGIYGFWYAAMRKALHINETRAAKSLLAIRGCFDMVEETLSDGRDFLCGNQFTAADLTFAALSSPILWPDQEEGFGGILSPIEELPSGLRELVQEFRDRPAGEFALRMFREHKPRLEWK